MCLMYRVNCRACLVCRSVPYLVTSAGDSFSKKGSGLDIDAGTLFLVKC